MLSLEIDRKSSVPPYRQLAAVLIARVRSGEYGPGDRLPSAADIVQASGCAEMTARKALRVVMEAGYAELSTGMGYYATLPGHTGGT